MEFKMYYELQFDKGEDALPVAEKKILCVCDGMGGSGGQKYSFLNFENKTGAYIASKIVSEAMEEFVQHNYDDIFNDILNCLSDEVDEKIEIISTYIKGYILAKMKDYAENNNITLNTKIKSALIKLLPTTMATIVYKEEKDCIHTMSFWAGDSRCYSLSPDTGLSQLSKDDLRDNHDALDNLTEDSPMSNCINLSQDFIIHGKYTKLEKPNILFVATDGCFGYFKTPMEFEYTIIDSLNSESFNKDVFEKELFENLTKVAKDDCSLAGTFLGFSEPLLIKTFFASRFTYLKNEFVNLERKNSKEADLLQKEIKKYQNKKQELSKKLLDTYNENLIDFLKIEFINNLEKEQIEENFFSEYKRKETFFNNQKLIDDLISKSEDFLELQNFFYEKERDLINILFKDYLYSVKEGACNTKEELDYCKISENLSEFKKIMNENIFSLSVDYSIVNAKVLNLIEIIKKDFYMESSFKDRLYNIGEELNNVFSEIQRYSNQEGILEKSCFKPEYDQIYNLKKDIEKQLRSNLESNLTEIVKDLKISFKNKDTNYYKNVYWFTSEEIFKITNDFNRLYETYEYVIEDFKSIYYIDFNNYVEEFLNNNYKNLIDFISYNDMDGVVLPKSKLVEYVNIDLYIKDSLEKVKKIKQCYSLINKERWILYKPTYEKYIL